METKKYMVLSHDGIHEYDITKTKTKDGIEFNLYYSNGEQWMRDTKGTLALSVLDDGNDFIFKKRLTKRMDYAMVTILHLLLTVERIERLESKYKIVEVKPILEI